MHCHMRAAIRLQVAPRDLAPISGSQVRKVPVNGVSWGCARPVTGSVFRRGFARKSAPTVTNKALKQEAPVAYRPKRWQKSFWTFIDVVAILGSVGGALAALLGVVSTTYALSLPLVLPVVSLIAALQREGLISEVSVFPEPVHMCHQLACSVVRFRFLSSLV